MTMKFDSISPDEIRQQRQVLLIGMPKCGKTLAGITAAENPNEVFILAADPHGVETLITNGYAPKIRMVSASNPIQDTIDILDDLTALDLDCRKAKKPFPFKAIVVDDVSTLQMQVKSWLRRDPEHSKRYITKAGKQNTRALYGDLNDKMTDLLARAKESPCPVVWLAWAREPVSAQGSEPERPGGAMLEGRFGRVLEGSVHAVVLLRQYETLSDGHKVIMREFRCQPFAKFNLHSRFGLPAVMPYDLYADNNGTEPEWSHGIVDILEFSIHNNRNKQPAKAAKKKSTRK